MFFSGFTGCQHTQAIKEVVAERELPSYVSGYYAIDPIVLDNVENDLGDNKPDPDLAYLYNVGSKSTQYTISGNGEITYLTSGVQAKSGQYNVTVDHLTYSPMELIIEFTREDGTKFEAPVGLVIGVSIRIKAKSTSGEGSFNLSDIPGLGLSTGVSAANANVEIDIIGIRNSAVLKLPRFVGEVNASTLQTFVQNLATINAEIDGNNTEIVPQIIGVDIKSLPEGLNLQDVVAAIREWKTKQKKEERRSLTIKELNGKAEPYKYTLPRTPEFVEKERQKRVEKLLGEVDKLKPDDAISIATSPPILEKNVLDIVEARDPQNLRLTDPDAAKEIIKFIVVLSKRDDQTLNALEAAIKATE